jgi:putative oxidoreductase
MKGCIVNASPEAHRECMTTTNPVHDIPASHELVSSRARPPSLRRGGALLLLRVAAGLPLLFHGTQKLFGWFGGDGFSGFAGYLESLGVPFPTASAYLAGASEVGGGLILLTGIGFWVLPPVIFTMLVAAATSARNGYDVGRGGAEYPLTIAVMLVALALTGPGSFVSALARRRTR